MEESIFVYNHLSSIQNDLVSLECLGVHRSAFVFNNILSLENKPGKHKEMIVYSLDQQPSIVIINRRHCKVIVKLIGFCFVLSCFQFY